VTADTAGRADLARWLEAAAANLYTATPNLARSLRAHLGAAGLRSIEPRLEAFGRVMITDVEPAVRTLERHRELPVHVPYDGIGRRIDGIEFHPAHQEAGRAVWASGICAVQGDGRGAFEQATLLYLLTHAGEGGHACPVVCTAGLISALRRRGEPGLQARFLPGLLTTEYDACLRGSQFLTEVQGGSDVGANAATAVVDPHEAGAWRVSGEKWFCSVADADLFAVTARPEGAPPGTRGLACFVVPRLLLDGTPNGFRIRRLKDKLGTRALASAEIDFDGALAYPIGALDEGFRVAVEELLNTSRWLNAAGSAGIMRRAYLEAASFARHRRAFGVPIGGFPPVREHLAVMKAEEHAALASTLELTSLVDRIDRGEADEPERAVHRFLVNVNKYLTSIAASDVVHRAIETLGGNGTIEDFSPLPRLYRDAVVFESWEGTHNVLCAQVRRDCDRLGLLGPVLDHARTRLKAAASPRLAGEVQAVLAVLDDLEPRLRISIADDAHGAAHFRRQLDRFGRAVQAACLLSEAAADAAAGVRSEKADVATFFVRLHLTPGYDAETDASWTGLVDAVLAGEAG